MPAPSRSPEYWGRSFWFCMHTVAEFYPEHPDADDMAHARNFFHSLQGVLPCYACAQHYAQLLRKYPVDGALLSRDALMRWVNMVHNEVNRRTGKAVVPHFDYARRLREEAVDAPRAPLFVLLGVALAVGLVVATRAARAKDVGTRFTE